MIWNQPIPYHLPRKFQGSIHEVILSELYTSSNTGEKVLLRNNGRDDWSVAPLSSYFPWLIFILPCLLHLLLCAAHFLFLLPREEMNVAVGQMVQSGEGKEVKELSGKATQCSLDYKSHTSNYLVGGWLWWPAEQQTAKSKRLEWKRAVFDGKVKKLSCV